jgi:single-strand selective monofunctional uracil DNA glycosylase
MNLSSALIAETQALRDRVEALSFSAPVSHVYNPLRYAWKPHRRYLEHYGDAKKKIIFLGMNPGPWGMTQTGIPFGEVTAAREWLGIEARVEKPAREHPARPIDGFACAKSEVSGRRLWGLFKERFVNPGAFFREHFVANYCPLVFLSATGANLTPDKLPKSESEPLFALCDEFLRNMAALLCPEWVIGVGAFAKKRAELALTGSGIRIGTVLHPSPASPLANAGWSDAATKQLTALGIWRL